MPIDLALHVSLSLRSTHANSWCQLSDVANGLGYLHSRNVIHGDLKGVRSVLNVVLLCIDALPGKHSRGRF
jgi:serine/threonine protein kinase